MEVREYTDANEAQEQARTALAELFLRFKDSPVLFLASGGSALSILPFESMLTEESAISVLDERFTKNPDDQNFTALSATPFFASARANGVQIQEPNFNAPSVHEAARELETALRGWKSAHPNGAIIATLGIGKDGHTAGILPYPDEETLFSKLFQNPSQWLVGYETGGRGAFEKRITATISFLRRELTAAIAYAVGEEKHEAAACVRAETGTLHKTPARVLREMDSAVLVTTGS